MVRRKVQRVGVKVSRPHPEAPYLVFVDGRRREVWTSEEARIFPEKELARAEKEEREVRVSVYRLRPTSMRADDRRKNNPGRPRC